MKTIQKKSTCLVSDRAYRAIITNCVNVMTEKNVSPDIFMAVIMAVKEYLETGRLAHRPINRVRNILDLFRPEIDRAIRRAESARKAAATRRNKTHPTPETETTSHQPPSRLQKAEPASRLHSVPSPGTHPPREITPLTPPRPSKGIRCPGIEQYAAASL